MTDDDDDDEMMLHMLTSVSHLSVCLVICYFEDTKMSPDDSR